MTRENWGSQLGFILAAAGSAVGLGAIWKFPYEVGKNGGGAYLLVFMFFVFTFGFALLLAEMFIGRTAQASATMAFRKLAGAWWPWVGRMSVLCLVLILGFYNVVGGWTIAYVAHAFFDSGLTTENNLTLTARFHALTSQPASALGYTAAFSMITAVVVVAGVQQGIERLCKVLMPLFFITLLVLIIWVLQLPGALEGARGFLSPDFSRLSAEGIISALGLAFFTLSVGCGMMISYGSYIHSEAPLVRSALWVVALASLACLLSGLLVIPAMFAFQVDPSAGPGLVFITMPALFAQMPGGQWIEILFFLLVFFAALTSSVSILEPVVSFLHDEFGFSRHRGTLVGGLFIYMLCIPTSLSFGVLSDWTVGGMAPFALAGYIVNDILLPAGGMGVALFVGWVVWPAMQKSLIKEGAGRWAPLLRPVIAIAAPALIVVLWLHAAFSP